MSVHEVAIGLDFLFAACAANTDLAAATPGGFHRGSAPTGTTMPFGIIGFQDGLDVLTINDLRVMDNLLFQAKIVGPANSTAAVVQAASILDGILKRTSGSTDDGLILSCSRQRPLQYDENLPTGEQRTHFGGLYRLLITQGA